MPRHAPAAWRPAAPRHPLPIVLAVLAVLAFAAPPLHAADVTLGATRGLGGAVRLGGWVPVPVEIRYTPADPAAVLEAELRLTSPDADDPLAFVLPLRLTPGTRRVHAYYRADFIPHGSLHVSLHDTATGRLRAEVTLPPQRDLLLDPQDRLLVLLSETERIPVTRLVHDDAQQPQTPGSGTPRHSSFAMSFLPHAIRAVSLRPAAAPDAWVGWEGADVVLWEDPDRMTLLPEQAEALEQWVWTGGRVLVTFSARREPIRTERLPAWLQVEIAEAAPRTLTILQGWAELPRDLMRMASGAWQYDFFREERRSNLIAPPRTRGEEPLSIPWRTLRMAGADTQDDAPVFLHHLHGAGSVTVLAFDPGMWPLTQFEGMPALLGRAAGMFLDTRDVALVARQEPALGSLRGEIDLREYHDLLGHRSSPPLTNDWMYLMTGVAALRSPVAARIPLWWLLAFLGAFLACIGPLEYALLRRKGRLHLTWLTFPVWIVLFSGAAYFGARYVHDHRSTARVFGMEDSVAGGTRRLHRDLTAIFSARNATATLRGAPWIHPYPGMVPATLSDQTWGGALDHETPPGERLLLTTPQRIQQAHLRQGMSRPVRSSHITDTDAPPLVDGTLFHDETGALQGELRVRPGVTLERAMLLGRERAYDIGTLHGGEAWSPTGAPHVPTLLALSQLLVPDVQNRDPAFHAMDNLRRLTFASILQHWQRMEPLARMQTEPPRWIERIMDIPDGMPSLFDDAPRPPPVDPDARTYPPLAHGYGIDALWGVQGGTGMEGDWSRVLLAGGWLLLAEEARVPEGVDAEGWLLEREGRVLHRVLILPPPGKPAPRPPLWGDSFYERRAVSAP